MGHYAIQPTTLQGEIFIPPSKSQTLRAIFFAALAKGKSVIHHYLSSPDTSAMIEACRLFGADVDVFPERIEIQGVNGQIRQAEDVIQAGNSGIVFRFCAAIGALASLPVVVTGDESIRHRRPIKPLLDGLTQLGVCAKTMRGDGHAPVIIQGPLQSGSATISGEDSQPVSALLIASAFAEGPITIHVHNPGEKPWVALTLSWFDRLGIPYTHQAFEYYSLFGHAQYEGFEYTVPGDLSSAAFPLAAALVTKSELLLKNVDLHDPQGDKELITVFQKMGATIEVDTQAKSLHVRKGKVLSGLTVDVNNFVDAFPILAVVACFAEGETHIYNAAIAKEKECNRIQCIAQELRKMGASITEREDGLVIKKSALKGATLYSFHDHRLAMSLAVAALGAQGKSSVHSVRCVSKTFPHFVDDFKQLGASIEENA